MMKLKITAKGASYYLYDDHGNPMDSGMLNAFPNNPPEFVQYNVEREKLTLHMYGEAEITIESSNQDPQPAREAG